MPEAAVNQKSQQTLTITSVAIKTRAEHRGDFWTWAPVTVAVSAPAHTMQTDASLSIYIYSGPG